MSTTGWQQRGHHELQNEISVMRRFDNPHVVALREVINQPGPRQVSFGHVTAEAQQRLRASIVLRIPEFTCPQHFVHYFPPRTRARLHPAVDALEDVETMSSFHTQA